MKKLFREFKSSLKDIAVEEAVDLFLFRPVSFVFVKFLVKIPITPNQISFLSLLSGIVSGIFFSFGDKKSFIYGGLFYVLCHIFDLLDGMIARLKKNGTALGRIIDGWVDYLTSIAAYLGFVLGLLKGNFDLPFTPWLMMIAASVSLALHSIAVDYYRQQYMAFALGKNKTISEDLRLFHRRFDSIKKKRGNYVEKILLFVYFGYTKLQVTGTFDDKKYKNGDYCSCNRTLLIFWNFIGVSTHRFFLVLAAIFYNPMIFFYYILIFANLCMAVLTVIQWRVDKNAASRKKI